MYIIYLKMKKLKMTLNKCFKIMIRIKFNFTQLIKMKVNSSSIKN